MNINAIRTVLLAIELGSLSAAGAQLGVPASTVSRRVKELETELGRRLIVRGGRGVYPAEEARDTLLKLKNAVSALEDCYAPKSLITRLRITATLEMTISLLPQVIPRFKEKYPDVVIELLGDDRLVGLVEADYDVAIRTGMLNDSNLIGKKIASGGFILVAEPSLAEQITSVNALASTPFVEVAGPPPGVSGHWKGTPFSLHPPVFAKLNSFTAALPTLFSGLAYAQVPPHLVREHLASGRLVQIKDAELKDIPVHALYPKRHRSQSIIKAFIAEVEALFKVNP